MSIITIPYSSNQQLTPHIHSRELRCTCGHVHEIKYDPEHLQHIEHLIKVLSATKIIISSGYRCSNGDKRVGGSGKGQHVEGRALDCKFYRGNTIIDARIVCCVAQDLGFRGIANISNKYQYVHLDSRLTTSKYFGDEIKGTSTVTSDFYQYFKLSAAQVTPYKKIEQTTQVETLSLLEQELKAYTRSLLKNNAVYNNAIVLASSLNGRNDASLSSPVCFSFKQGEIIQIGGSSVSADGYDWVQAKNSSGQTCYVAKKFVLTSGDQCGVTSGAKTFEGKSLAKFVYQTTYTVLKIAANKVTIGINGVVTANIATKDILKK